MKSDIKTTIIEQPGKLSDMKARKLSRVITALLKNPEMLAETNRRIAEQKEQEASG